MKQGYFSTAGISKTYIKFLIDHIKTKLTKIQQDILSIDAEITSIGKQPYDNGNMKKKAKIQKEKILLQRIKSLYSTLYNKQAGAYVFLINDKTITACKYVKSGDKTSLYNIKNGLVINGIKGKLYKSKLIQQIILNYDTANENNFFTNTFKILFFEEEDTTLDDFNVRYLGKYAGENPSLNIESFDKKQILDLNRDWKVNDFCQISYKFKKSINDDSFIDIIYDYIIKVYQDPTNPKKGRGLKLINLDKQQNITEYLSEFRLPVIGCFMNHDLMLKYNQLLNISINTDDPDAYVGKNGSATLVYYDRHFINKEKTGLWYLLNHSKENNVLIIENNIKKYGYWCWKIAPDKITNFVREIVSEKRTEIILEFYYGDEFERIINGDHMDVDMKMEYVTKKFVKLRF